MTILGLSILTIAWLVQFFSMSGKDLKIKPLFLVIYCLGVMILIIDGILAGSKPVIWGNTACIVTTGLVLAKVKKLL
ncbi:MAG: hypothetical protein M1514_00155 [Patescibacteria group bacterium]|nr:hypothetical protein [Patescibacteria group bacterium]